MSWFSALFVIATVVSLGSGYAYFRGLASRRDDPARYWSIIGCYLALALLMPLLQLLK